MQSGAAQSGQGQDADMTAEDAAMHRQEQQNAMRRALRFTTTGAENVDVNLRLPALHAPHNTTQQPQLPLQQQQQQHHYLQQQQQQQQPPQLQLLHKGVPSRLAAAYPDLRGPLAAKSDRAQAGHRCTFEGCGKSFKERKVLRKHMLTHQPRRFHCEYPGCGKAFYERAKLKRHHLVHSGEKNFPCTYKGCNKRFALKANLLTHYRTHTGTRPYMCPYPGCRKSFSQTSGRNSHYKTHLRKRDDNDRAWPSATAAAASSSSSSSSSSSPSPSGQPLPPPHQLPSRMATQQRALLPLALPQSPGASPEVMSPSLLQLLASAALPTTAGGSSAAEPFSLGSVLGAPSPHTCQSAQSQPPTPNTVPLPPQQQQQQQQHRVEHSENVTTEHSKAKREALHSARVAGLLGNAQLAPTNRLSSFAFGSDVLRAAAVQGHLESAPSSSAAHPALDERLRDLLRARATQIASVQQQQQQQQQQSPSGEP